MDQRLGRKFQASLRAGSLVACLTLVATPLLAAMARGLGGSAAVRPAGRSLFAKGAERFRILDESGRTPVFRLLNGSSKERAIAFAINAAIRASPGADQTTPSSNYVEARLERLELAPDRGDPSRLRVTLQVSGYEVELRETVDRKAFVAGEKIGLRIRPRTEEAPPITIESRGHLAMRWDARANAISIPRAEANFALNAPLSDDVHQNVEFKGIAVREGR